MHVLIKKETGTGRSEYVKISNVESVIFFDDVTARTEIYEDEYGQPKERKPQKPKNEV